MSEAVRSPEVHLVGIRRVQHPAKVGGRAVVAMRAHCSCGWFSGACYPRTLAHYAQEEAMAHYRETTRRRKR